MRCKCDKCGHTFEPTIISVEVYTAIGHLTRNDVVCPYCQAQFPISYEDDKIKELQKKLKVERPKLAHLVGVPHESQHMKVKQIQNEIKQRLSELEQLKTRMKEL